MPFGLTPAFIVSAGLLGAVGAAATVAGLWMTFRKAGQPGWAALVPLYNIVVLLRIAGLSAWLTLLFFVPLVNIVLAIVTHVRIATAFGKEPAFGIGLILFPFVFYPILGFTDSRYAGLGPGAGAR